MAAVLQRRVLRGGVECRLQVGGCGGGCRGGGGGAGTGWEVLVGLGLVLPASHVHQVLMLLVEGLHLFVDLPPDVFR